MKPRYISLGFLTLLLIGLIASSWAAGRDEDRVKRLSGATRKEFERFRALSVPALEEIHQATAPAKLEAVTREILTVGNLSIGSRSDGLPVQQFLKNRLAALAPHGVELLGVLKGTAMTPVKLPHTRLQVGRDQWPVLPLWPNGIMPALCPTNGISGTLVDVGQGRWEDIEGKELRGAIALMDFAGGRNWELLYALGVRAVIVCETARPLRLHAEGLFCNTPVPCPRFYVDHATGEALRERAGQTARLDGGAVWEQRPTESLFAYLPPTAPVQHTVQEGETLDTIAARYALKTDELVFANSLSNKIIAPGQTLVIPNLPESLLVLALIDSVNVVPDVPHGAKVAANLAAALVALEHLATSPHAVRRKGIIFGFLDGEHLGGLASRELAENFLRNEGNWGRAHIEDPAKTLARYRALSQWLHADDAARPAIAAADAQWLVEKWLRVQLDEHRIGLAEYRAAAIQRGESTAAVDAKISKLVQLSKATIDNRRLPWDQRVLKFRALITAPDEQPPVRWDDLMARFAGELAQEEARAAHVANNLTLVRTLREKLGDKGSLGFQVDFGDATSSLMITDGRQKLRDSNVGTEAARFSKRFRDVIAFATVQAGWGEEWPFLIDEDRVDMAFTVQDGPMFYSDFWKPAGVRLFPLVTANDNHDRLDTPADVPDRLNFHNLAVQARTALVMWQVGLESPTDSFVGERSKQKTTFGRLIGRCVRFNARSGIDAQQPVPQSLVYYPAIPKNNAPNTAAFRGGRRGVVVQTLLNGTFVLPVETLEWNSPSKSKPVVYAYHLNRELAVLDLVVDRGRIGTQTQEPKFKLLLNQDVEKKLVLTDVRPLVFFPGLDPTDYKSVGSEQLVKVHDAVLKGDPSHYAHDNPGAAYNEEELESNILYLPAGRRAQFILRKGNSFKLLLVGDVTEATPEGAGVLVDGKQLTMPLTPLLVARQMYELAQRRQALYRKFGITDKAVEEALARASEKLQEAEAAMTRQQWQELIGRARETWGILVKYYPRIMTMGRQAVFSAVLLMALLLPSAVFAEKLLIGGKGIVARLIGTVVIFLLGVALLNFLHPAFRISVSPFIIVIAYMMILMSGIVLVLCYQRFEVLVRRARAAGGEVEGEEISLVSSLGTALALGVSNLKKRKTRTFLTAFTVTALTFSIVTFVSVKGSDSLLVRQLELDRDVEGEKVEPLPPRYQGVMLREYFWAAMNEGLAKAIESEFGTRFSVTRRGHYLEVEGGNNAEREGINQIEVRAGKKSTVLMGVMAFEPAERDFSALHEAVSGQQWFTADDLFHCILPDHAAAALGITAEQLLTPKGARKPDAQLPQVQLMNRNWRVIGILDTKQADRIRDINGRSLAMIDYLRSAYTPSAGSGDVANETAGYHVSWRRLLIVPLAAKGETQVRLRSVAIRFPPEADTKTFYRDLALRVNRAVFGTVDGRLSLITTKQKQSVGGIAKIIVPVILTVLIVTNTMLGALEERKGEVGMLGAIGLSPSQISFLLLSESLVFSIIGIVCGTFGGLAFANFVPWVRLQIAPDFLITLSLNFASLTAIGLALGTGVVVLLATLFPAKKAARLAAPSGMEKWKLPDPDDDGRIRYVLPFTLTRGNAVGMIAFFRRFLLNHTEATSQDFNCRHIRLDRGAALVVRCTMWLQPYDLDVAQEFEMQVQPTANAGIFAVALTLHRTSGTAEAWLRTNYGFLDLVRRQFLLWRNLDDESRKRYIQEGVELFQPVPTSAGNQAQPNGA